MARTAKETTRPGYVNRNDQRVVRDTGLPGNDHVQRVYELACGKCDAHYGANGSDIFQRKCPQCGGGAPGLSLWGKPPRCKACDVANERQPKRLHAR
jgi:hypothetical protein